MTLRVLVGFNMKNDERDFIILFSAKKDITTQTCYNVVNKKNKQNKGCC